MTATLEDVIQRLQDFIAERYDGNISAASRALGLKADLLNKWIKGVRSPPMLKLMAVVKELDRLEGQDEKPEPEEVIATLREENRTLGEQLDDTKKKLAEAEIRLDERRRWVASPALSEVCVPDEKEKKTGEKN